MPRRFIALITVSLFLATSVAAQAPPAKQPAKAENQTGASDTLQKKVESQVRKLYALGPSYTVKASAPAETPVPGLLQVQVQVTSAGQSDTVPFFITSDGRYFLRGEFFDTNKDPFAETRAQINLAGAPSKGPANARVIVVEYGDFQCPTCRQLYTVLKSLQPQYPQVRFIFKDFPLEQIHPWAMTASIAGRCAYQQNPTAFWKLHDRIFDNQEIISPTTAWQTMLDYAAQTGLDADNFRACMTAPETRASIQTSVDEAIRLKIANTPTVFVNGRRIVGADAQTLDQYIRYELSATAPPATALPKQ